jgi:hypothetical protein
MAHGGRNPSNPSNPSARGALEAGARRAALDDAAGAAGARTRGKRREAAWLELRRRERGRSGGRFDGQRQLDRQLDRRASTFFV